MYTNPQIKNSQLVTGLYTWPLDIPKQILKLWYGNKILLQNIIFLNIEVAWTWVRILIPLPVNLGRLLYSLTKFLYYIPSLPSLYMRGSYSYLVRLLGE